MKKTKQPKLDRFDKFDMFMSLSKQRSVQILMAVGLLYMLLVTLEIPVVFRTRLSSLSQDPLTRPGKLETGQELEEKQAPSRPLKSFAVNEKPVQTQRRTQLLSGLKFYPETMNPNGKDGSLELPKSAKVAWEVGKKLWVELESGKLDKAVEMEKLPKKAGADQCPNSVSMSGSDLQKRGNLMELPCGLTLGSHITVVGKPRVAHSEKESKISIIKEGDVKVSQFRLELQGLRAVDGEEPPRIFHFNPRVKGDFSGKPVIEMNTCYRMQWGPAQRCEGWRSRDEEETVDGQVKCEKWSQGDNITEGSGKASWWINRLIGRTKKVDLDWPFPFAEQKLFVLTLSAGLEGYQVNVDGKHVTSFPYRTGFALEDATGLLVNGDIDVHSVFVGSLPISHPSFAPQKNIELSGRWKAPPLSNQQVDLFIGILSAGNHFAERMAVRKSWMQHNLVTSSKVVARFFVALSARKEVNLELKKEAEFFGDIVIVPYMDTYDLVVLKTVAICEYGARRVSAKYIMKCDDDTFVRVDAVLDEAKKVSEGRSIYVGNINYYHKPLREGKWAVKYEEWPEEDYPPYANGPGYILSADIAHYVVEEFEKHKLRLFKMEDVSMGMWVEQFSNGRRAVDYLHSLKFCQFGCIENYHTAHYQSPRQMICLWDKLVRTGKAQCCNMR